MFRMVKQGIVRETESRAEVERWRALGYELASEPVSIDEGLSDKTVAELTALCKEQGLEISKNAKKAELIALLGG
mgnify:CR=1 FL=1